jgi:hypothetical protein
MAILWSFVHGTVNELQIKSLLAARETGQNLLREIGQPFCFDENQSKRHCTIRASVVWQE